MGRAGESVPFERIAQGTQSSFLEKSDYVIRTDAELKDVWTTIRGVNASPPNIDFSEYMVLALFQGQKPSGGYSIAAKAIEIQDTMVEVSIVEEEPGTGCAVTDALTAPYEIIVVKKMVGQLISKTERVVMACP